MASRTATACCRRQGHHNILGNMAFFRNGRKKIERYRENLSKKIPYLLSSGGEPILRLLELMMTAIDYDEHSRPIHRLLRDIGCRFGAGYPHTARLLETSLNYASYTLNKGKTITVQQWYDTIIAVSISLEKVPTSVGENLLITQMKKRIAEMQQQLENAQKPDSSHVEEIAKESPGAKEYNVRQTAIIAYALCKGAGVLPKNKKNIATVFHNLTGYSHNTIGQNLCTTYSDSEIEKIAKTVEKDMPEFAAYLRKQDFYLPEVTK